MAGADGTISWGGTDVGGVEMSVGGEESHRPP